MLAVLLRFVHRKHFLILASIDVNRVSFSFEKLPTFSFRQMAAIFVSLD